MKAFANLFSQNKNKLILTTGVPVDFQLSLTSFSIIGDKIICSDGVGRILIYNLDFTLCNKNYNSKNYRIIIDGMDGYYYAYYNGKIARIDPATFAELASASFAGIRGMCSDGTHIYYTMHSGANDGIGKVLQSDLSSTATLIAANGSGNNEFSYPTGIIVVGDDLYICDSYNYRIKKHLKSDLSYVSSPANNGTLVYGICTDGTNFFASYSYGLIKFNAAWGTVSDLYGGPGSADAQWGNPPGKLVYFSNRIYGRDLNGRIKIYSSGDALTWIQNIGVAGDGSSSLCDPVITGPAGTWIDSEGGRYAVASGANISKNGFSGDFFRGSPNRLTYQPTGKLSDITAIDFNADAIQGEVKNLYKCVNLTSLKLQTNPAMTLNLSRLSAKLTTLWAYACGAGIFGSIRHMTALTACNLRENAAPQSQVDAWIDDLWQNRDVMAICAVNLNGNNAAPSGVYQDASPPTTGNEKVFDLVENYGWTVANS